MLQAGKTDCPAVLHQRTLHITHSCFCRLNSLTEEFTVLPQFSNQQVAGAGLLDAPTQALEMPYDPASIPVDDCVKVSVLILQLFRLQLV